MAAILFVCYCKVSCVISHVRLHHNYHNHHDQPQLPRPLILNSLKLVIFIFSVKFYVAAVLYFSTTHIRTRAFMFILFLHQPTQPSQSTTTYSKRHTIYYVLLFTLSFFSIYPTDPQLSLSFCCHNCLVFLYILFSLLLLPRINKELVYY